MAILLTISNAEILKLCRLDPADGTADADATEVKNRQQEAVEKEIKPSAFADATLTATLQRNVAKLLAAEVLGMRRREEGAAGSFAGAGVSLSAPPDVGADLREEAWAALAPYRLHTIGRNVLTDGQDAPEAATGSARQSSLFGRDELGRTALFRAHWRD